MTTTNAFCRFAAFALLAAAAWPAQAYRMSSPSSSTTGNPVLCDNLGGFVHWPSNQGTFPWYHNTAGQGAGKADALQLAMTAWNSAPQSDHVLSYAGTTSAGLNLNDSQNTLVWGDTSLSTLCGTTSCHAITSIDLVGAVIQEVDILFNQQMTWRTDGVADACSSTAPGTNLDTRAVATHELGHSLGIGHPLTSEASYPAATMGGSSCNVAGRSLHSDDLDALQCVTYRYPVSPAYEGFLDAATCRTVAGWAWNASRGNEPVYLELRRGSTLDHVFKADLYRADLQAAGKGNGWHAFSLNGPFFTPAGQWTNLGVRYTGGTNGNLSLSPKPIICGLNMFPSTWAPDTVLDTAGTVYTVGTQFSSTHPGQVTHLGYYRAQGEGGSHTLTLWQEVASPPGYTEKGSITIPASVNGQGWIYRNLPTPVDITAGTLYRVSVNTNTKQAKSPCSPSSPTSLHSPFVNSPLTAHQGFWKAGTGFPDIGSCSNYFVSVRFDL